MNCLIIFLSIVLFSACDNAVENRIVPPENNPPAPDTEAPSVPGNVAALALSESAIQVSWDPASDNVGVEGYRIYRDGVSHDQTTERLYLDTGLSEGTEYSYRISAHDTSGNESSRSSAASAWTSSLDDTEAPSVPAGLDAEALSTSSIQVTWNPSSDNVGVAGYRIYRDDQYLDQTAVTVYLDSGLNEATEYSYQVSAFDPSDNESARSSAASATTSSGSSGGETYLVGPGRTYTSISQVRGLLNPGDLVLVDAGTYAGGITFSRAGTVQDPITIRGVKAGGQRPVLDGGNNVVEFNMNNYVFEGFEIQNAGFRGLFHHADNIVIRDCIVHDCPHGILGADEDSGDILIEYCEIYHCGEGAGRHQIYISTNEDDYPGSVFRLQFCYIHDGNGGNNIKSRAEYSEIYYNWVEYAYHHNLELIGPDPLGGVAEDKAREDSEVVGNVFITGRYTRNVRIGGDGPGQSSWGRVRFMNNTFIHENNDPESHIFAHFDIESVEMHNNVFYLTSAVVFDDSEANWVFERRVSGTNNWVHSGTGYPVEWTGTLVGTDPGFINMAGHLLRPAAGSVLIGAGSTDLNSPAGSPFLNPLASPLFHPPEAALIPLGSAEPRPSGGVIDIGAFNSE